MMSESSDRLWQERTVCKALDSEALQRALGIGRLAAEVLSKRDLGSVAQVREFLQARLSSMPDPFLMAGMDKAVVRLARALREGERIAVHGDYDVDGVTGTALLVETLRACGGRVEYHIPLRTQDGYGVSMKALETCVANGSTVAVTVDCGITAHEEAKRAADLGIDLIVTDHHQPPPVLPEALAILNPARDDCAFPFKSLAGVGVVFMLLVGLRKHLRESGYWRQHPEPDLRFGLDLVALGTIADIVPLKGLNRTLTRAGLDLLSHSGRPGLQALKKVAGVEKVSCGAVGFRLAPRINAAGRLQDAAAGVALLLTPSLADAMPIAEQLDRVNRERQGIEQQTFDQADERWQTASATATHSIVLADERWHPGVIGIVASRLVEKYHRPTVLIALDGEDGKGSGRSIGGLHLFRALQDCCSCLRGFGGHEYAAGLSIDAARVGEFAELFEGVARQQLRPEDLLHCLRHDGEAFFEELDLAAVEELAALAPFGPGNPQPVFLARGVHLQGVQPVGTSHLRFTACQGGYGLPCIAFGMGGLQPRLNGPQDILFTPQRNEWRGKVSLQLQIRDIRPAAA